jgi:hypothetical protein
MELFANHRGMIMAAPYFPFALGAIAGAALAIAAPVISRNSQPALKEAVKTALILVRQAQVKAVEFVETLEDTYAEARLEAQASMGAAHATAGTAVAGRARAAAAPSRKRAAPRKAKAPARKGARRVAHRGGAEAAANA